MRKCGTCSACCRWPAVPEIGKPPRVSCPQLEACGHGCTIYMGRPTACAEYQCSWLRGTGAEEDQPDTSGVLIDRRMTRWGLVLVAKPLTRWAPMLKPGENAISRAAQQSNCLCLIMDFEDAKKVIGAAGPKVFVEQFKKETKEKPVRLGGPREFVQYMTKQVGEGQWPVI